MIFNLLKLANNIQTNIVNENGAEVIVISGQTFPIKNDLMNLGFRWNPNTKTWYRNLKTLLNNPTLVNKAKALGINLPITNTQPNQQNWLHNSGTIWYLAIRKSDNTPIVISKHADGWQWMTQDGQTGILPNANINLAIESKRDANGKPISNSNPTNLFKLIQIPETTQITPEKSDNKTNGRIPENMISEHQLAIQNTFLSTPVNITMSALAGTGKTSMLRHLASFKPPNEKWLYIVFGKKNQTEGKEKFPPDVEVVTSHSFLGRVLGKNSQLNNIPETDIWTQSGERISLILDQFMDHDDTFPFKLKYSAKRIIKQLASLAKCFAINPQDPNATQLIQNIIANYQIDTDLSTEKNQTNIDYKPQLIEKTLETLQQTLPGNLQPDPFKMQNDPNYRQTMHQIIETRDHDDTLWYTALHQDKIQWPKYDVVLADEVQDFNRCQTIMLQKLAQAGARVIAVGDVNQAIFGFRGSDANAFNSIEAMMGTLQNGNQTHSLPVNYRCGKNIIKYVNENTHVNNLQAGVDYDGIVTEDIPQENVIDLLTEEWQSLKQLKMETAFIARTNAPLINSALELMRNNIDFVILGRDLSKELIKQIQSVTGTGRNERIMSIPQLQQNLELNLATLSEQWKGKISKEAKLKELTDVTTSLVSIIENLRSNNFIDSRQNINVSNSKIFIQYLQNRFGGVDTDSIEGTQELKKKNPLSYITLTTAHKSKGLEYNRVFILNSDLFPHPNAKSQQAITQERNLEYVALTRAKHELHVLIPPPKQKPNEDRT